MSPEHSAVLMWFTLWHCTAAQVCGAILIKLLMDMYRAAGPGNSYVLVLRMLRRTLTALQPQVSKQVMGSRCVPLSTASMLGIG
jgi:hypothetical protein